MTLGIDVNGSYNAFFFDTFEVYSDLWNLSGCYWYSSIYLPSIIIAKVGKPAISINKNCSRPMQLFQFEPLQPFVELVGMPLVFLS